MLRRRNFSTFCQYIVLKEKKKFFIFFKITFFKFYWYFLWSCKTAAVLFVFINQNTIISTNDSQSLIYSRIFKLKILAFSTPPHKISLKIFSKLSKEKKKGGGDEIKCNCEFFLYKKSNQAVTNLTIFYWSQLHKGYFKDKI